MRKLLVRNQPDAIGVERVEELIHVALALGCAGLGEGEERHRLAELAPRHEAALVHVEVLEEVDHAPNVPMKHLVKRCNARGRAGRRRRPATAAAATAAAATTCYPEGTAAAATTVYAIHSRICYESAAAESCGDLGQRSDGTATANYRGASKSTARQPGSKSHTIFDELD